MPYFEIRPAIRIADYDLIAALEGLVLNPRMTSTKKGW
jgi:hypothetical protein